MTAPVGQPVPAAPVEAPPGGPSAPAPQGTPDIGTLLSQLAGQ